MDKTIIMRYLFLLLLLLLPSCNRIDRDPAPEDYDKLFPFGGIDKPDNIRGDMVVKPCDPELALENYTYPGEDVPAGDEYEVVLTCVFNEVDNNGRFVDHSTSQYTVSYINEKKELVVIVCGEDGAGDEEDEEAPPVMENGIIKEITFKVRSGFPMYLSVNGVGPRNSNVKASIKATSVDGLVETPELSTEQYQNEEGPNKLRTPYCEFIILP
ncbi:Uncharacterised protein [Porphyromonas cangingivalis]|uniref:Uncharacterized protein n=2 Tax=Porphyromonas cangingivalis TaxID=36874 RepID=A0A1T4MYS5_PORCN|nr:hypothetical protein HQ34_07135 [Porphyromonas cangingivalis]SJZ72061.1 hypothetical protein SAMN02745205_01722 [Porphyromonas cangingivalis]SPY35637.1 Uncharacterised protein [Porphyromonas cangingivalis]VEJ04198.1 Uncharacterised protein [Porphyromonas cangingivalis]